MLDSCFCCSDDGKFELVVVAPTENVVTVVVAAIATVVVTEKSGVVNEEPG